MAPSMTSPSIIRPAPSHSSSTVEHGTVGDFDVCWACLTSPAREGGEDAAVIAQAGPDGIFGFAIDGMGGMAQGREAAETAGEAISRGVSESSAVSSPIDSAIRALREAHAAVLERCPGGGATVAGAVISRDHLRTIHAGDTEVLVFNEVGTLWHRTPTHSPVGRALQLGLVDEEAALTHPERHLVSSGLGVSTMCIQLSPSLPLEHGDTVLVATDGVTDNAREEEIIECLRRGPLNVATSHLVDLCRDRMKRALTTRSRSPRLGKPDDLTMVVIRRAVV